MLRQISLWLASVYLGFFVTLAARELSDEGLAALQILLEEMERLK